jgi:hypothetical protein
MTTGDEQYLRERSHGPGNESRKGFNWRLPLYGALGACVVFLLIIVYFSDIFVLLYLLGVSTIIVILLLVTIVIRMRPRQRLSILLTLVAYVTVTGALFINYGELRPSLRWLLWSHRYKAELLAAPDLADGDLKHIEWDGWGWGGNDTVVYVVFDPTDSLSAAAKSHSPGRFRGIPCEVPRVRRLESRWYSVVFYTGPIGAIAHEGAVLRR